MLPNLSLVLGGASSGKSGFAERLAISTGLPKVYIATAQAFDAEMTAKIAAHKKMRGTGWIDIEAPNDLATALYLIKPGTVVLVDCATMWLSNRLLAEADLESESRVLVATCAACAGTVVVVSNEVGMGIVPDNALARRFRVAQGQLNQHLAQRAELVVAVMAGLPLTLKGAMPAQVTP
ncbi:MAG: adenosylcobinamide kinase/adenosylcobinamide-phosphate guanylyltransferase [Paracoccaceae bacterium]|jgi:adenosylcobinamide kinase/adenosylcobinamide-phosphate guanylyltransferase